MSSKGYHMSVDLSPENEQFIDLVVAQGACSDRREALDEAVQLLRRRERFARRSTKDCRANRFQPRKSTSD